MCSDVKEFYYLFEKISSQVLHLYNSGDVVISEKSNNTPVTQADIIAQNYIQKFLSKTGYPIISEESTQNLKSSIKSKYIWVVDPLDGTSDFIKKTGEFCIMIGLLKNNCPYFGIIFQPTEKKLYYAQKGKGAFIVNSKHKNKKLVVSRISSLSQMRIVLSKNHIEEKELRIARNISAEKIQKCGSVGLKAGLISQGKADLYFTFTDKISEWDTCAVETIVKEAGGEITDTQGNALMYNKKNKVNPYGVVISNGQNHAKIIEQLSRYKKLEK